MPNKIVLLGAIRGLVSEGVRAIDAMKSVRPDVIGLSISKESLLAMEEHFGSENALAEPVNVEEEIYMKGLAEFGEVVKPPPCFSEPWKLARESGVNVEALDMDDEHYTTAYCKYVSGVDMIRQGGSEKKFLRHSFEARTPQEFVMEFDSMVNRLRGYRELEAARELWMGKRIRQLAGKHHNVLAIIELERLAGIRNSLREMDCEFSTYECQANDNLTNVSE